MLSEAPFGANIPVKDLKNARRFYEETLELTPSDLSESGITYEPGGSVFEIYPTESAGKAEHTLGTFLVPDIDAATEWLRSRGVTLEEYDLPQLKTVDGIARLGPFRVAWFKDPDGNILSVGEKDVS